MNWRIPIIVIWVVIALMNMFFAKGHPINAITFVQIGAIVWALFMIRFYILCLLKERRSDAPSE